MKPEDKQQYLDMIPRVFVRALRDPHGNEEFLLSEGEATDLLRRREIVLRAQLTARSKLLVRARKLLINVKDELDDEGDRVYFGSTNDADIFRSLVDEMDGWVWQDIILDADQRDYIGELQSLNAALSEATEWLAPESAPEYQRVLVCWRGTPVLSAHTEIGVRHPVMGWKNNYGHLFGSAPDGWRPMPEPLHPMEEKDEDES